MAQNDHEPPPSVIRAGSRLGPSRPPGQQRCIYLAHCSVPTKNALSPSQRARNLFRPWSPPGHHTLDLPLSLIWEVQQKLCWDKTPGSLLYQARPGMASTLGRFLSAPLLLVSLTFLEKRSLPEELTGVGVGVSVSECRWPSAWSPESPSQRERQ